MITLGSCFSERCEGRTSPCLRAERGRSTFLREIRATIESKIGRSIPVTVTGGLVRVLMPFMGRSMKGDSLPSEVLAVRGASKRVTRSGLS